jgi:hypothetical protein
MLKKVSKIVKISSQLPVQSSNILLTHIKRTKMLVQTHSRLKTDNLLIGLFQDTLPYCLLLKKQFSKIIYKLLFLTQVQPVQDDLNGVVVSNADFYSKGPGFESRVSHGPFQKV